MSDSTRQTAVITGGSRGIGRAICVALAGTQTDIFFNYFSPSDPEAEREAARETESQVSAAGGRAKGLEANVASEQDLGGFFNSVIQETGRIDILVNNAGITKDALLVRMKPADWDDVININLKAVFLSTQLAAKVMMKQRSGRIINMASVVGVIGNIGQANYVASKAGVIGLTKTAARELAPRGITVNAVAPGFIETDMTAGLPDKVKTAMMGQIPLGRSGKPEDVAGVVAFLASERAAYLTGQVIHVSGGMYI